MLTPATLTPRSGRLGERASVSTPQGSPWDASPPPSPIMNARPPYGAAFFASVAETLGLIRSQRLLDVGAGPGILAIGFAPYCREVVGVDPGAGDGRGGARRGRARGLRDHVHRGSLRGRWRRSSAHSILSPSVAPSTGSIPGPRVRRSIARSPLAEELWLAARQAPKTGAILGSRPSTMCAIAGRAIGLHATIRRFSPAANLLERDHPSRADLRRSSRAPGRMRAVDVDFVQRLGDEVPAMKSAMREALAPAPPIGRSRTWSKRERRCSNVLDSASNWERLSRRIASDSALSRPLRRQAYIHCPPKASRKRADKRRASRRT